MTAAEPFSPAARQLFTAKGIAAGVALGLGVREQGDELVYPDGRRRSLNGGGRKHSQPAGTPLEPWWVIAAEDGTAGIVEGGTDALAWASALGTMPPVDGGDPGILSIPGTETPIQRVVDALRAANVTTAYIATDNDKAGVKCAAKLAAALVDVGIACLRVSLPEGADLADVLAAAEPQERGRVLADLLQGAQPHGDAEVSHADSAHENGANPESDLSPPDNCATVQPPIDRAAEWEKCEALATQPQILDCFTAQLARAGLVGEDKLAKIIKLATVSRMLPKPVNVAVKGPSAGGKSFTVEVVLSHFPESAYYALSAMSERALAYSEEPLVNRMLVIYEAAGMESDFSS